MLVLCTETSTLNVSEGSDFTLSTILIKRFGFPRTANCCFLTVLIPPRRAWRSSCFHISPRLSLTRHSALPLLSPMRYRPCLTVGGVLCTGSHFLNRSQVENGFPLRRGLGHPDAFFEKPWMFLLSTGVRSYFWLTFHDLPHGGLHVIHSLDKYLPDTFYMTVTVPGLGHAKMNK